MGGSFKFEGFSEIDNALAALPAATSKAVGRRALKKALTPVAEMANDFWPGADPLAFAVSAKLKSGQTPTEAVANAVVMYVGAAGAAPHAHLLEWGTAPRYHKSGKFVGAVAPSPSLTPAWEANRDQVLNGIADVLREEIAATLARRAKRGR